MAPEERLGKDKEVAAERFYVGSADSRKDSRKEEQEGKGERGMIMRRREGIEMERLERKVKRQ